MIVLFYNRNGSIWDCRLLFMLTNIWFVCLFNLSNSSAYKWDLIVISVYFSLMVFPCASWASVYFSLWSACLSRCFVLFCFIFYRLVCLIFTFRYLLYTQDKKISICMYCSFLLGEHPSSLMVSSNDEKFYLSFFFPVMVAVFYASLRNLFLPKVTKIFCVFSQVWEL